jgi:IS5 family transposase
VAVLEGADAPPDIAAHDTDDLFHELLSERPPIAPLRDRVDLLFPKKRKKTGQTTSPRTPLRRSAKAQSGQRRKGGKAQAGRAAPARAANQAPAEAGGAALRILSPPRGPRAAESDDYGSDIVITEIIEKQKK